MGDNLRIETWLIRTATMTFIDNTSGVGGSMSSKLAWWKWLLALTIILLLILMWRCGTGLIQDRALANTAVRQSHQELNAARYDEICREADEDFAQEGKCEEFTKFLEAVHAKMGTADSETLVNVRLYATTNGNFIMTQYMTIFAQGSATETFTWVKSNSRLRLQRYRIQSSALDGLSILPTQKP